MIDYGEFMALAAVETPRRVKLSVNSLTLFQSGFQWFRNPREWEDDTDPLSDLEEDIRDALVAEAFYELQGGNVDIGIIFLFATAAPPADSLACDGVTYLRVDYPELYAVLDPAFITDADHFVTPTLPDYSGSGFALWAK